MYSTGLVERGADVVLIYAGSDFTAYWNEFRRRSPTDITLRIRSLWGSRGDSKTGLPQIKLLRDTTARLGVRVETFKSLLEPRCLRLVETMRPDVVHNLSTLFVPERFLAACEHRVVGAHYAELPRLRGSHTVRWSVLLDVPLTVTHLFLCAELDLGDVLHRTPVPVERGDDVMRLRAKCQAASANGHLAVADAILAGTLVPEQQRKQDGSMFFRMGAYLRQEVDTIMREEPTRITTEVT